MTVKERVLCARIAEMVGVQEEYANRIGINYKIMINSECVKEENWMQMNREKQDEGKEW